MLLVAASRSETQAYERAAAASGIDLWIADARGSAVSLAEAASRRPIDGLIAVNVDGASLAAAVAEALSRPWHTRGSVRDATNRLRLRGRLLAASLPGPWFFGMPGDGSLADVADRLRFPCVVKPAAVGERIVAYADTASTFEDACARVRQAIEGRRPRFGGAPADEDLLVEGFVPGRALALEGVLEQGALRVLAIVDRPDLLAGPSDADTPSSHAVPSPLTHDEARLVASVVAHGAAATGLRHGPIHADCRINEYGAFVLGLEPWPGREPRSRALRFATVDAAGRDGISLEELLLRHAAGEALDGYGREADPV